MTPSVSLAIRHAAVDVAGDDVGIVSLRYEVLVHGEVYEGAIGAGETALATPEVLLRAKALVEALSLALQEATGLGGTGEPDLAPLDKDKEL